MDQWRRDVAVLIATALREHQCDVDDVIEMFAVDLSPWNGVIALALLTRFELKEAAFLGDVAEMAAWRYYDFGTQLECWKSAPDIGSRMRKAYEEAGDNRSKLAEQFFRACSAAIASKSVQNALKKYRQSKASKITIAHPDTGEEFYPPNTKG